MMCWCWERLGLCCWIPDVRTQGEQITFSVVFTSLPLLHVSSADSLISLLSGELAVLVISSSPQSMQTCCLHLLWDSFTNQMFYQEKSERDENVIALCPGWLKGGDLSKALKLHTFSQLIYRAGYTEVSFHYFAVKHNLWKVPLSQSYNLKVMLHQSIYACGHLKLNWHVAVCTWLRQSFYCGIWSSVPQHGEVSPLFPSRDRAVKSCLTDFHTIEFWNESTELCSHLLLAYKVGSLGVKIIYHGQRDI